ncbi:glycine cleavage system protein GcvH [Streptomyces rubiginosohelvolus]
MPTIPADLRYAGTHEWVRLEADGTVTVGLTDYALRLLGDVAFVELAEVGRTLARDEAVGVVESTTASTDVYAPVGGEVIAVYEELGDCPELLSQRPYVSWIFKVKPSDKGELDQLLDAAGYSAAVGA